MIYRDDGRRDGSIGRALASGGVQSPHLICVSVPLIVTVWWRLARPGHRRVCGRKNKPCSSSRRFVSRSKTALGKI